MANLKQLETIDGIEVTKYKETTLVTGNTYPVKDKLKELNLKWDPLNKCWYAGNQLDGLLLKPTKPTKKTKKRRWV